MQKITPFLWFDDKAEEAAEHYVSVFNARPGASGNSKILGISRYGEGGPGTPGTAMTVSFVLEGQGITGLNGGPDHGFTDAFSFLVSCEDQDEVDALWTALSEGGEEGPCGWLKDRFGLSWQIVPPAIELMAIPIPAVPAVVQAMLKMARSTARAAAGGRGRVAPGCGVDPRPEDCCANWRRRSSARWFAGMGSSTPPRMPCRRPCWPRR
jgi:predicted 3-demethylubiquinone-9 3-methyltransferase (glyoxalase superfamily)